MAYPHGTQHFGERHVVDCLAGSLLAKGDIVQSTEATGSNTVDNAATNVAVFGIALEAIASGAIGKVLRIRQGDQFWLKVSAGTVVASTVGKYADIVDELSVTLTNSNNDVRCIGWDGVTTDFAIFEFGTPEAGTTTILA